MERILFSKYSDERKKEYCIRTDILEIDDKKVVRKSPIYEVGMSHVKNIYNLYKDLTFAYRGADISFNTCEWKDNAVYLEYIPHKTLQMVMEEYIDANNDAGIEALLHQYIDLIRNKCPKRKFVKTKEFVEVFGDVSLGDHYESLEITDIDLIFSNIMVDKQWEVIDYEWTFTFPIPIEYVMYRAFYLAHHQMRRCKVLEFENLMKLAGISEEEQSVFAEMEVNFQRYITGDEKPFREILLSTDKSRKTFGEELYIREKKILDLEIQNNKIEEKFQVKLDEATGKCQMLQNQVNAMEQTKWWRIRTAILKIMRK